MMRIRLRNLTHSYRKTRVLDRLNIDFISGSANVVIGPNGAGKTTLLRLIDLLEKPSAGELYFDGVAVSGLDESQRMVLRRRIGFVFQAPLLFRGTVRRNAAYGLKLRRRALCRERIEEAMEQVGLRSKMDQDAMSLSGGEKQRLQLARVMLLDPELYLLDEPTANLDPLSARRIEETILRLLQAGKTVILTTHNLIQARRVGDRFYFLGDGRLLQEGTALDIFHFPSSLGIAEFSSAENIIYGDIRDIAGSRCLVAEGQMIQTLADAPLGPAAGIIRPEDILISKGLLTSSARNSIAGTIRSIERLGILFAVGVRCGKLPLTSFITPNSLEALDLKTGDRVYLTFKATAIHILPMES